MVNVRVVLLVTPMSCVLGEGLNVENSLLVFKQSAPCLRTHGGISSRTISFSVGHDDKMLQALTTELHALIECPNGTYLTLWSPCKSFRRTQNQLLPSQSPKHNLFKREGDLEGEESWDDIVESHGCCK